MPITKYYAGNGREVMANMKRQYGDAKGEQVFYAVANQGYRKPSRGSNRGTMPKRRVHPRKSGDYTPPLPRKHKPGTEPSVRKYF